MTFGELSRSYAERVATWDADARLLDAQLARLKERREKHEADRPYWVEDLVTPIADELAARFPDRTINILGPFGLGARVSIHVGDASITFQPGDVSKGELLWVDMVKNTGTYAKNTLGEVNGLNHPAEPVPDDADVEWFVNRLK